MTIVPSEVNENGEVSYVLIVSQPDDGTKQEEDDDVDMSIYDFKVRINCLFPSIILLFIHLFIHSFLYLFIHLFIHS